MYKFDINYRSFHLTTGIIKLNCTLSKGIICQSIQVLISRHIEYVHDVCNCYALGHLSGDILTG